MFFQFPFTWFTFSKYWIEGEVMNYSLPVYMLVWGHPQSIPDGAAIALLREKTIEGGTQLNVFVSHKGVERSLSKEDLLELEDDIVISVLSDTTGHFWGEYLSYFLTKPHLVGSDKSKWEEHRQKHCMMPFARSLLPPRHSCMSNSIS